MRFLAALLIALALTTGSTLADAAMRPFQTADRASVLLVMGALRKYDGEWRVIDNDTHAHAGVQQVLCGSNGVLTIIFKEAGVQTGAGSGATPDEYLAQRKVTAGASGSKDQVRIHIFRGTDAKGNAKRLSCKSSLFDYRTANFWFVWYQVMAVQPSA